MEYYSYLIKPASSLCNLKCKYCFYHDVSEHREVISNGVMSDDTLYTLIDRALVVENEATITFAFQGGEPTVAGLDYFVKFTDYVSLHKKSNQTIQYAIQTNGVSLEEEWCQLFKKYHFLVGVSLDGYRENHDYFRLTNANKPTFKTIMAGIERLKKYQIDYNILTVLSQPLAKHPEKLYRFFKEQKFKYVQLIPCLPGLDNEDDPFKLTPQGFAKFYKIFYRLWEADYLKGDYMSVTLFDNLILMFKGIPPHRCGMLGQCLPQYVIESNGHVYPCDFYVLDEYDTGNIKDSSFAEIRQSKAMKDFLAQPHPQCDRCVECKFKNICHGNCKRLSITYFDQHYCGYQDFLEEHYQSMAKIAQQLK